MAKNIYEKNSMCLLRWCDIFGTNYWICVSSVPAKLATLK